MLLVGAVLLAIFVVSSPWDVLLVGAAALAEVGESLLWIRLSRRRPPQVGAEALVGATGVVTVTCRPVGQVRVRGELWRARSERGADEGDAVQVARVEGLTLVVEPCGPRPAA